MDGDQGLNVVLDKIEKWGGKDFKITNAKD